MKTMKPGKPEPIDIGKRYVQFNAQDAVRDVFDAIVELVTNSDDSYHRLYKNKKIPNDGGRVLIEIERRRTEPSLLIVRDRAEGLSLEDMHLKIRRMGHKTSAKGDRGFMARGAKDCATMGSITFKSIKDDRYHRCEITSQFEFVPYSPSSKATKETREKLRIRRGNGTVVTLRMEQGSLPLLNTLLRDLPLHYAVRDILSEDTPGEVLIRDLNQPKAGNEKLIYRQPDGELKVDITYQVDEYPEAQALLRIWRAAEPLENRSERFRRNGIIVKGDRAIHECSLLSPEFEQDSYAAHYFGRIECPYIDKLCAEYDERREAGEIHPKDNPKLLIDPHRQRGLHREHPFTKALLRTPIEQLRALVAQDKQKDKEKEREVANAETRVRLDRLAKAASRFLKQQLEEIEELATGDEVDNESFTKRGFLIFPTFLKIALGEERRLTVYAKKEMLQGTNAEVHVEVDSPALRVIGSAFNLIPHPKKDDRVMGTFSVRGEEVNDAVLIRAISDGLPPIEAIARVVEHRFEERLFDMPIEFEYENYRVREGSRRTLKLYAKYPELVTEETAVSVASGNSHGLPIRGSCTLVPIAGTNFALGEVVVQGRQLVQKPILISAEIHQERAETHVRVVQKDDTGGPPIKIEIVNEDFVTYRSHWASTEGKPNLLLVSAKHPSIRRYLGEPPKFEGQDAPHFRILLAEIVAESVCRKALTMEAKDRTWEFHWADLKEDQVIAELVLTALHKRIREFAADAHAVMLSDAELKKEQ